MGRGQIKEGKCWIEILMFCCSLLDFWTRQRKKFWDRPFRSGRLITWPDAWHEWSGRRTVPTAIKVWKKVTRAASALLCPHQSHSASAFTKVPFRHRHIISLALGTSTASKFAKIELEILLSLMTQKQKCCVVRWVCNAHAFRREGGCGASAEGSVGP